MKRVGTTLKFLGKIKKHELILNQHQTGIDSVIAAQVKMKQKEDSIQSLKVDIFHEVITIGAYLQIHKRQKHRYHYFGNC